MVVSNKIQLKPKWNRECNNISSTKECKCKCFKILKWFKWWWCRIHKCCKWWWCRILKWCKQWWRILKWCKWCKCLNNNNKWKCNQVTKAKIQITIEEEVEEETITEEVIWIRITAQIGISKEITIIVTTAISLTSRTTTATIIATEITITTKIDKFTTRKISSTSRTKTQTDNKGKWILSLNSKWRKKLNSSNNNQRLKSNKSRKKMKKNL